MEDDEGNEGDSGVDDSEDEEDDDDEEEMPDEDFFASSGYEEVLDAYHTIWDPRIYYLRTAAIRLGVVYHEYTYLVETLEAGVDNWVGIYNPYAANAILTRNRSKRMSTRHLDLHLGRACRIAINFGTMTPHKSNEFCMNCM